MAVRALAILLPAEPSEASHSWFVLMGSVVTESGRRVQASAMRRLRCCMCSWASSSPGLLATYQGRISPPNQSRVSPIWRVAVLRFSALVCSVRRARRATVAASSSQTSASVLEARTSRARRPSMFCAAARWASPAALIVRGSVASRSVWIASTFSCGFPMGATPVLIVPIRYAIGSRDAVVIERMPERVFSSASR
ncbi:hypothetical protein BJF79_38020 [Actinomadura sp. CNU-125]|nr:hypothetical protein BJF79_38020 [Actinomadura sp. CNU-125]